MNISFEVKGNALKQKQWVDIIVLFYLQGQSIKYLQFQNVSFNWPGENFPHCTSSLEKSVKTALEDTCMKTFMNLKNTIHSIYKFTL